MIKNNENVYIQNCYCEISYPTDGIDSTALRKGNAVSPNATDVKASFFWNNVWGMLSTALRKKLGVPLAGSCAPLISFSNDTMSCE